MNIGIREKLSHLSHHFIHKFIDFFIGRTKRIVDKCNGRCTLRPVHKGFPGTQGILVGTFGARKFRISHHGCQAMAGHIYFGDNLYKSFGSIIHYIADLILGIKTSVSFWFIGKRRRKFTKISNLFHPPGPGFGQFRQGFNFNSPTFIVGKVPVKHVIFVAHHGINVLFYFIYCKKMTCHIEHQPTPANTRIIANFYSGNFPRHINNLCRTFYLGWKELNQCLRTVKQSCRFICPDSDFFGSYRQNVSFIANHWIGYSIQHQLYVRFTG